MNDILFRIGEYPVSGLHVALALAAAILLALVYFSLSLSRLVNTRENEAILAQDQGRDLDDKLDDIGRLQAELTGRLQTLTDVFGSRQSEFAKHLGDRIESLRTQVGQGLEANAKNTGENLAKLNERLAVIDTAQANLANLTGEMLTLKDILANKQSRGAYGQGRMEAIVRDGLPAESYGFQVTLSNKTRPDCVIHLPGDPRVLVIDAKFPLESVSAFRNAQGDEARKLTMARVRTDIGTHLKDISDKYLLAGETQDMALMFVPSESVYADLHEHFDDLIQRAHRTRVVIVSPSLLSMAIQLMQSLMRDARIREEARTIQTEVGRLVEDVVRLKDRVDKLDTHFRQAQEDVIQVKTSAEKITRRGERISQLEFDDGSPATVHALDTLKAAE